MSLRNANAKAASEQDTTPEQETTLKRDDAATSAPENLVARSAGDLSYAFRRLSQSTELGCDTETAGFSSKKCRLLSVQLSDGKFSVLVPTCEGVALGPLAQLLESADYLKIFHNAKFDLRFLFESGYRVRRVFDTMLAEKLITRGADQSASLAETLYRYFAVDLDKSQRQKFASRGWDGRWTPELVDYALADVIHLPELKRQQEAWLERLGLKREYAQRVAKMLSSK
ncbi:MAG TPA: hypothetical protein VM934_12950 [Pyrinomonadaceae bacterium]|jgi:ribonuclease D|nr:hypothetical protein [Pyrinomonadaceae bacterium]